MAAPPAKKWQLVDEKGIFIPNIEQVNLGSENIAVVSIIGAQSSGKSTLLNKCFSTNFPVMDASQGMSQTTQGIWIAKVPSSNDGPKILLIDTEGSDSSERDREGDDSFQRKSAAFALTMSNTVIVNMKCENLRLHHGGSWPLLKTVFQVMLLGKFTSTPRKVLNLIFVLRDKNKSPLPILKKQLKERLDEIWQEIWAEISKSEANKKAELKDYFNVEVMTMSNYTTQEKEFDEDVKGVRELLFRLVKDGQICPALNFLDDAKEKWDGIMKNKILKLNLNKAPEAIYCHVIMKEKSGDFLDDTEWDETKTAVESGTMVKSFGELVNTIMDKYLAQYDDETLYFDGSTRNDCRDELKKNLSTVVERIYLDLVAKMRAETLEEFVEEIATEIKNSGKFEAINSKKFITKFSDLLGDARVEHASWKDTHADSQLEKMQSELDSYEKGARTVIDCLNTQEQSKVAMLVNTVTALGCGAALGAAIVAPPVAGAAAITALGLGVAFPLPPISVVSIIQALIKYVEAKKRLGIAREESPAVEKIMKVLGSNEKQGNKDREDRPEVDKIMGGVESIKI